MDRHYRRRFPSRPRFSWPLTNHLNIMGQRIPACCSCERVPVMTDYPPPPRQSRMGAVRAWMKSRMRLGDDVITVGITSVITLIFIVYTILAWPHPFRLSNF